MKYTMMALALASVGAALVVAPLSAKADETVREAARADERVRGQVERLMPQLVSKDDAVRRDAEERLFALGAPGRNELERVLCEDVARRMETALRLLRSNEWYDGGREFARGSDSPAEPASDRMRTTMDDIYRYWAEFDPEFAAIPTEWPDGTTVRAKSSGELMEKGRHLAWTIAEDGSVKVTTKDSGDAPARTVAAKSVAEFRANYPDIAQRLEFVLPRSVRSVSLGAESAEIDRSEAQQPMFGIEWSPVPVVLSQQLDISNGMVVENVFAGTLAERLGVQRNDVLLEVNGETIGGSADIRSILDFARDGDKVTAVVLRTGKRKSLETVR